MVKRNIVRIDDEKCNGCGLCIPNCHEGALKLVDGKARLVSESYCDGLGNCLGHCPQGAITIVEEDVREFDFKATNEHLRDIGREEMEDNPLEKELPCGCPGSAVRGVKKPWDGGRSSLEQWPVQLRLLPPNAPFFQNSHILVCADCVPFATPRFHSDLLRRKTVVVGCPKLDNVEAYGEKLRGIFRLNKVKSVTVAMMEVPCCQALYSVVRKAVEESGKEIPVIRETVRISGEIE